MEKPENKRWITVLILSVLIAVQLARILYVFAYEREGYHSDENWSYGFANSYFDPYLYSDDAGNLKNFNTWTSSQVLRDYLVVNKGESFSFGSVYQNQEYDMSPPLHTMILHTICSFFPGSFSWWYSFSINIAAFLLTMILLYLLGAEMTGSRWAGWVLCLFYGFTTGALNTFVYLRMYAVLTMLAVLSAWLHSRMHNKQYQGIRYELIGLAAVTVTGILTHYYFLVLSFFLAACVCVFLMLGKQWKKMFRYAGSMLVSVGLAAAVYPFMFLNAVGVAADYAQMPYAWRLKYCIFTFIKEITGITIYPYMAQFLLACYAILLILVFLVPLCFLFRKETWFKKGVDACKRFPRFLSGRIRGISGPALFLLLSVTGTLAVVAGVSNVLGMKATVDRYLFFLMPLFCAVLVKWFHSVTQRIPAKPKTRGALLVLVCVLLLTLNNIYSGCNYLFERNSDTPSIEEQIEGSDCILLTDSSWRLTYFASRLMDTDRFFCMLTEECMEHGESLQTLDSPGPIYMILETNNFPDENGALKGYEYFGDDMAFGLDYTVQEFLDYLTGLEKIERVDYLSTETCFAGTVDLYRVYMK